MGSSGDIWIGRLVVIFLGVVAISATIASCVLADAGREVPNIISSLGTASIIALGSVLSVLKGSSPPQPPPK